MEGNNLKLIYRGKDRFLCAGLVELIRVDYVMSPTANCQFSSIANFNDIIKILTKEQLLFFITSFSYKPMVLINIKTKKNYQKIIDLINITKYKEKNILLTTTFKFKNKLNYTLLIKTNLK
jgi:hypothetical protein